MQIAAGFVPEADWSVMSFLEIFSPSLRHLREERQRSQRAVDHPDGAGGAPLGIDLESGRAVIRVSRPPVDPTEDAPEPESEDVD